MSVSSVSNTKSAPEPASRPQPRESAQPAQRSEAKVGKQAAEPRDTVDLSDEAQALERGETSKAPSAVEDMSLRLNLEFGDMAARDRLEQTLEPLATQATWNEQFRNTAGTFMTADQLRTFENFAQEQLDGLAPAFEDAAEQWVESLNNPGFQEVFSVWEPEQQAQLLMDASRYFPMSDSGLNWIAEFNEGLAGTTDNVYAQTALALREDGVLSESDRRDLEQSLGIMLGVDQAVRPDGSEPRLAAISQTLGFSAADLAAVRSAGGSEQAGTLANSAGSAFTIYDVLVRGSESDLLRSFSTTAGAGVVAPSTVAGAVEDLAHLLRQAPRFSGLAAELGAVGRVAGQIGGVLTAGEALNALAEGDYLGAAGAALPLVGLAFPPAALAATAGSLAISAYQWIEEQASKSNFDFRALEAVFPNDPAMVAALHTSIPDGRLRVLEDWMQEFRSETLHPSDGPTRLQQLQSVLDQRLSNWKDDPGLIMSYFYQGMDHELQEQRRLEVEARLYSEV